ncbi:SelT/SelW/SelH family protein [Nocardioides sp. ChNu-153]|uniref:SelT/SelW/SelH family protein n=1 Tax=unclassified Nocardioides TaxID=2615069 RepID=UPI002405EE2F|nr:MULTISPECIES: SelT/SelW/SelH family protein [unclassified Nocardioides]MDF9715480.1 SelT/SelW/SelH family protein [Nocardioides sp. ChNu-99]MDN7120643.1 SelT/SelW/SelH family protein [Nocardioides sp. ChNu-153]
MTARVRITYCTRCNWLLRASWYAGELLQTFTDELDEVALAPATGGAFRVEVEVDGVRHQVWDRAADGGFPEITELKRRVRDLAAPERGLGHADRARDA